MNHALSRMLGYEPEELVGRDAADVLRPEDLEASAERVRQLVSGETATHDLEEWIVTKTGEMRRCHVTSAVIGVRSDVVCTVEDITERIESQARATTSPSTTS